MTAQRDGWAIARESSPMVKRWRGEIITPQLIAFVQRWLFARLGVESSLCLERVGDRNKVVLQFSDGTYIYQAEVRELNAVRKRAPRTPADELMTLFQRTA